MTSSPSSRQRREPAAALAQRVKAQRDADAGDEDQDGDRLGDQPENFGDGKKHRGRLMNAAQRRACGHGGGQFKRVVIG